MTYPVFFDSKNSTSLFGLYKNFEFLSQLYQNKKLPKVLMLTGNKGVGKSTLINHFLFSVFDKNNYDKEKFTLLENSKLPIQLKNNVFSNIIYINGSDFKSVKIEDIRVLKKKIFQSSIVNKHRFIIFDDVEQFNINSINALLKIIEEPNNNDFFFLIYNKTRPVLDTIKSRSIEIKVMLTENQRLKIIEKLSKFFNQDFILDPKETFLSPGNFIKYNYILKEYEIYPKNDFIENFSSLLSLFKKKKDFIFINIIFFLTELYLKDLKDKKTYKDDRIYEIKNFIFENINIFLMYNMSQSSLIRVINSKLKYD